MSDFKAKMHQIVCRLGELTELPRPPSWILRPTSKGEGKGTRGEGRGSVGERGEGKGRKEGWERRGQGRPPSWSLPPDYFPGRRRWKLVTFNIEMYAFLCIFFTEYILFQKVWEKVRRMWQYKYFFLQNFSLNSIVCIYLSELTFYSVSFLMFICYQLWWIKMY